MILLNENLVCEIAKHMCLHERVHALALVSNVVAKYILNNTRYIDKKLSGYDKHCCSCEDATKHGHLLCLRYLHQVTLASRTHPFGDTFGVAIETGYLDCFQYAYENGCWWYDEVTAMCAQHGRLEFLKYAHENGAPWYNYTTVRAVEYRNFDCLEYAHENGCPWHVDVWQFAIEQDDLECVKYLHEHGCPWDAVATLAAWVQVKEQILCYLYENGCPVYEDVIIFDPKTSQHCDRCEWTHFHFHWAE